MLLHFRFSPNDPIPLKPFPASPNQGITFYPRGYLTAHHPNPETGTGIRRPQTVVFGQHINRITLQLAQEEYLMFDVSFQPGVLARFLRNPLSEFVDQNIDAESVIGAEIRLVNDQLAHASHYEQMVAIVENYLWKRIQRLQVDLLPLEKASRHMLAKTNLWSLDQWAGHCCLSISQFERKFREQMGVSPKLFARIVRFDRAFWLKETNPQLDWLSVALQTGYYDYQHLVKDFKQFGGTTPPLFLNQNDNSPEKWLRLVN
ncbi:helix-turn-helix domain-containing protein [Nibrella saemangeumensis]|uniref:Helix-turn-helix domain-containing protein n=2 Tax=Nibrella saemangeumensis TaxID=1084526 RepID=A0ABP8N7Y9_9BACT